MVNKETSNTICFSLMFNDILKKVTTTKPIDLTKLLRTCFPKLYYLNSDFFYYETEDPIYKIKYKIDNPEDIYENAIVFIIFDSISFDEYLMNQNGHTYTNTRIRTLHSRSQNFKKMVKIRGLPWECSKKDIIDFFKDQKLIENNIKFLSSFGKSNNHTGEAIVEFESESDIETALKQNRKSIKDRYIEVFTITQNEADVAFKTENEKIHKKIPVSGKSKILKLLGCPYNTTKEDVEKFLFDVLCVGIHIYKSKHDSKDIEIFVEVENEEDIRKVFVHNKQYINERFVDVKMGSMEELVDKFHVDNKYSKKNIDVQFCVHIKNIPPNSSQEEINLFFSKIGIVPVKIHKKVNGDDAFCEFESNGEINKALLMDNCLMKSNNVEVSKVDSNLVVCTVGIEPLNMMGDFGQGNEHVVKLGGIPFESDIESIKKFLEGYDIIDKSIVIGYGTNGRKNGNAYVSFRNEEERDRALEEKQRKYIGNRYIVLTPL